MTRRELLRRKKLAILKIPDRWPQAIKILPETMHFISMCARLPSIDPTALVLGSFVKPSKKVGAAASSCDQYYPMLCPSRALHLQLVLMCDAGFLCMWVILGCTTEDATVTAHIIG